MRSAMLVNVSHIETVTHVNLTHCIRYGRFEAGGRSVSDECWPASEADVFAGLRLRSRWRSECISFQHANCDCQSRHITDVVSLRTTYLGHFGSTHRSIGMIC